MSQQQVFVPTTIIYTHENGSQEIFERHEEIGHGGFATVYRVTHKNTNKVYAMKVISKEYASSKGKSMQEKLKCEMKIQKSLNHPNIVRSKLSFSDAANIYIVLEYCPGKSVRELLKKSEHGYLSEPETRKILKDIIRGLVFLHNHQIIHHDLKLENFLIGSNGKVKIADFGLSTVIKDEEEKQYSICGTTNYLSPEIINKEGHSFEVDVWATGVSAFIMLTGQAPFGAGNKEAVYENIRNCDYDFPTRIPLSFEAKSFIKSILKIDPRRRPTAASLTSHQFLTKVDTIPVCLYRPIQAPAKIQSVNLNQSFQNIDSFKPTHSFQKIQTFQPTSSFQKAQISQNSIQSTSKYIPPVSININIPTTSIQTRGNLFNSSFRSSSISNQISKTPVLEDCDNSLRKLNLIGNYEYLPPSKVQLNDTNLNSIKSIPSLNAINYTSKNNYISTNNVKTLSNENIVSPVSKNTFTIPNYFVSKYSIHKGDMGYMLCDGTVGICFKNQSRIVMDPNEEFVQYYKNYDSPVETINIIDFLGKRHEKSSSKDKLQSKLLLVLKFAKSLKKNKALHESTYADYDPSTPLHHVKYFLNKEESILFKFNDKNIQVNFNDHKKLIIFWNTKKMCLVRSMKEKCDLLDLKDVAKMNPTRDEFKKFRYAKHMLNVLAKKI